MENSARGGKLGQMRWMFNRIAPSYDFLNHLFTLNIDQLWRRRLARMVAQERPKQVLDLATGTADLAIALARKLPEAEILGLDISTEMMAVGEKKICKAGLEQRITLDEGNAEALTQGDESFDAVTVG
ncbi:MAG: class I SAM-dependent methyltransferase, partial [Alistipes sp.]|nr:class I SAM-dependent methyltransferase [Alistipes sp.]